MSSSQNLPGNEDDLRLDPEAEGSHNSDYYQDALFASDAATSISQKKKKKSKVAKALDALRGGNNNIPQELVTTVLSHVKAEGGIDSREATEEQVRETLKELKIMDVMQGKAGLGGLNRKDMGEHKFWATQPVPQLGEGPPTVDGCIDHPKPSEDVRQDPYPLPKEFEWTCLDISDEAQNKEVYDLLSLNYVEDDHAAFRFQYSGEFLAWALKPPGYHKEWHIGVRVSNNKKLVAFISGVPLTVNVRGHVIQTSEINYLCVHKKLRSKRLAPVLIKEVTRQCHLKGVFQAIYTAGVVIPTPISICRYYHRTLNIPKLVETKFTFVPRNMTVARMIKANKVSSSTSTPGLREIEEKDIPQVATLFAQYMTRFDMSPIFTIDEVRHQFISGKGQGEIDSGGVGRRQGQVTWTYVVENPKTLAITDFFSFYSLPSKVIGNTKYPVLEAAYLFYYATSIAFESNTTDGGRLKKRLMKIIGDALVIANNAEFDVFNALTLMDNVSFLHDLNFGVGDGFLNFYLYNWRTANLAGVKQEGDTSAGRGVGVVML